MNEEPRQRRNMFCPSANETLVQLTEKTKLFAQKCSIDSSPVRQPVATFRSYICENIEMPSSTADDESTFDNEIAPQLPSPNQIHPLQCFTVNLTSLNRLIKSRCSFMSSTSPQHSMSSTSCNTFPRKKKSTAMWYIKVSI